MASKTNAVRLVQQAKIPCREQFYEFDENDEMVFAGSYDCIGYTRNRADRVCRDDKKDNELVI